MQVRGWNFLVEFVLHGVVNIGTISGFFQEINQKSDHLRILIFFLYYLFGAIFFFLPFFLGGGGVGWSTISKIEKETLINLLVLVGQETQN